VTCGERSYTDSCKSLYLPRGWPAESGVVRRGSALLLADASNPLDELCKMGRAAPVLTSVRSHVANRPPLPPRPMSPPERALGFFVPPEFESATCDPDLETDPLGRNSGSGHSVGNPR
jgi:hypothetical protein